MHKLLCFLFCFIFVLSMAACAPVNNDNIPPTSNDPSPVTPPDTEDAPLHILYAISVPNEVEQLRAADGTLLFEYAYQHIQVHLPDQNVSDKITLDFLTRVDNTRQIAADISAQAENAYTGNGNWSAYKYHISYSPTRIDSGIISMFGTITTYTGGLHPEQNCVSITYDAANGESLTLGSILNHIDNKQDICDLVLEKLDALDYQYSLFDGYESMVKDRFLSDESTDEAFYFTNTGLCFYFAPYELAPFSTGIISVEIPYDKLPGILADAYFPDEYQPSTGNLIAELADGKDISTFEQIIEAILDPHGDRILLYSNKTVQRLTITHGSWTPDGLYFQPEYVIFRATGTSADKAFVVRMSIPEMLPDLMVSYETADGVQNYYISMSGEDNTVLLLPVE